MLLGMGIFNDIYGLRKSHPGDIYHFGPKWFVIAAGAEGEVINGVAGED